MEQVTTSVPAQKQALDESPQRAPVINGSMSGLRARHQVYAVGDRAAATAPLWSLQS